MQGGVGRVSGGLEGARGRGRVGRPRQKVGVVQRADSWADRWNDRRIGFSKSSARIPILSHSVTSTSTFVSLLSHSRSCRGGVSRLSPAAQGLEATRATVSLGRVRVAT